MLNVRSFGSHVDYINNINRYYDKLFEETYKYLKGKNYNEIDYSSKYSVLNKLNNYVDKLEKEKGKVNKAYGFCNCSSKNDYKEVKSAQMNATGLNSNYHSQQGMY